LWDILETETAVVVAVGGVCDGNEITFFMSSIIEVSCCCCGCCGCGGGGGGGGGGG